MMRKRPRNRSSSSSARCKKLRGNDRAETFGGTVSGSPTRDPRKVRSCSPLPARSGERIKVRGASDCMLTANMFHAARARGAHASAPLADIATAQVRTAESGFLALQTVADWAAPDYASKPPSNSSQRLRGRDRFLPWFGVDLFRSLRDARGQPGWSRPGRHV